MDTKIYPYLKAGPKLVDRLEVGPQKALWYSSSMQKHIRVCDLKDRHLLGAIGVERLEARVNLLQCPNPDKYDTWRDHTNPIYTALVKEALYRFLTVPDEPDFLRQAELSIQNYVPSDREQEIYRELYPDDKEYPK